MNICNNDSIAEIGGSFFMNADSVLGVIFINLFSFNSFCQIMLTLVLMIFDVHNLHKKLYEVNCFNLNLLKILRFHDIACVVFFSE